MKTDNVSKFEIPLNNSIRTDSLNESIKQFGDDPSNTPHVQNTGLIRYGGITNLNLTTTTYPNTGYNYVTQNNEILSVSPTGQGTSTVSLAGTPLSSVSSYGVESNLTVGGYADVIAVGPQTTPVLPAGGYVALSFANGLTTVSLFNPAGVLQASRQTQFTGLGTGVTQFATIHFVRSQNQQYSNPQQFLLRIGANTVIMSEGNPSQAISACNFVSPTILKGQGASVIIVYGSWLIVAGGQGLVSSFDGQNWKQYDGTGIGTGPYHPGVFTSSTTSTAIIYNNTLVLANGNGQIASFDGYAWNTSSGVGGGSGVTSNNAAGALTNGYIQALGLWSSGGVNFLVVGTTLGEVSCTDGHTWYSYNNTAKYPGHNFLPPCCTTAFLPTLNSFSTITRTDGVQVLVATGNSGYVYSFDGGWIDHTGVAGLPTQATAFSQWTTATINSTSAYNGLNYFVYGNGLWVNLSKTNGVNDIATSPDLVTWTIQTTPAPPSGFSWNGLAYGNGVFIVPSGATGTNNFMSSPDGINWTLCNGPTVGAILYQGNTVAFNGSIFLLQATGKTYYTSTNGTTWTLTTVPAPPANTWQNLWSANNRFFISNNYSTTGGIITSTDGVNWTACNMPAANVSITCIIYANNLYVMTASGTSTTNSILTSTNGTTWTLQTCPAPTGTGLQSMTYGNGYYVGVCGSNGTAAILYSTNGTTWTAGASAAGGAYWGAILYNNKGGFYCFSLASPGFYTMYSTSANYTGIYNNGTAFNNDNVISSVVYNNQVVFGTTTGYIASVSPNGVWTNFNGTGGTGIWNNQTVLGYASPGGNNITTMLVFGSTLVVIGGIQNGYGTNQGYIGSWDGSNWKNRDGTGTGTGIWNYSVSGITSSSWAPGAYQYLTACVYNNSIAGIFNGTYLQGLSSNNSVIPYPGFYLNGVTAISNLLLNENNINQIYCYRYEAPYSNMYLLLEVGNSLSLGYILDNSGSNYVYQLNAQYAVPQVSNGFTRHILTGKFYYPGQVGPNSVVVGNGQAISTIGFTNFQTFSTSPVFPTLTDTVNTSGVLSQTACPGGIDVTYNDTAAPTSIQSCYYPSMVGAVQYTWLNRTTPNTNTLINGYGKLTNNFGEALSLPFEIRVGLLNGVQSFLSVAPIDGLGSDNLGTLITNVGEYDYSYIPSVVYGSTFANLTYKYNGAYVFVRISTNPTNAIQRLTDRLYKINTISPNNIVDSMLNTINIGSADYNGRMIFNGGAISGIATYVASELYQRFSNGIDVGNKLPTCTPCNSSTITIPGACLAFSSGLQYYQIDTYINNAYSFSTLSSKSQVISPMLFNGGGILTQAMVNGVGTTYSGTTATTYNPVQIGLTYQANSIATSGSTTYFLYPNFEGYLFGNSVPLTYQSFVLNGQTFLYNGQAIYLGDIQQATNILNGLDFVCYANGLTFLCVSPTTAFFLSSFDNSIFTFSGGRNVSKFKILNNLTTVSQGGYNTRDNTLILDAGVNFIIYSDDMWTMVPKAINEIEPLRIYNTTNGLQIGNNVYSWQYSYFPQTGSNPVPLVWQSAFLGQTNNEKSINPNWIIKVYSPNNAPTTIYVVIRAFDGHSYIPENKTITLMPSNYDNGHYAYFRVSQKMVKSLASSLQLTCLTTIQLLSVAVEFRDDVTETYGGMVSI